MSHRCITRHCERSDLSAEALAKAEAIQNLSAEAAWIALSRRRKIAAQFCRELLAMTGRMLAVISWLWHRESSPELSAIMKQPCVYMFANRRNGTIYTGVTSNPPRRAYEHREGLVKGFSSKYGCKLLVWYELHASMTDAITREKQIKAGSRANKLALIESVNPDWTDLYETLI